MHCEKESTRVFDFGIEVRTDGIEVRDYSSQEMMKLGKLKVRFISYFITVFSFMYTNCWYSNNSEIDESIISYYNCNCNTNKWYSNAQFWYLEDPVQTFGFTILNLVIIYNFNTKIGSLNHIVGSS